MNGPPTNLSAGVEENVCLLDRVELLKSAKLAPLKEIATARAGGSLLLSFLLSQLRNYQLAKFEQRPVLSPFRGLPKLNNPWQINGLLILNGGFLAGFSRVKRQDGSQSLAEVENEIEPLIIDRGPFFDKSVSRNVTALVGKTTYLGCRVRNLGNRTVSWIRHRDLHLLTVNRFTYTSDQRFSALHNPHTEDWTLQVRYPQRRDAGTYECQVATTPPIGHSMYLSVVEPVTTLLGGPEMYINKGSTMNLTCVVQHSPEPPPSIYWTHDQQVFHEYFHKRVTIVLSARNLWRLHATP
ncbi:hypothetical protein HUJ05_006919 [Dendroctonus ponderosae]|nr:hypothetical protein HUJ05_006919 [Dendroctonus ponderosae]